MNFILLEAAQQGGGSMQFLFTMGLMFVVLYFLIFRPQRKKQKDHQNMIENLKIHDTIVTTGGIIGKIVNIKKEKNILVIRVDETNNTKIEFQRNAVAGVISEEVKG
ncbi:preprotein translocase subunit YajC [Candidatus Cloacimonadota bacterium]